MWTTPLDSCPLRPEVLFGIRERDVPTLRSLHAGFVWFVVSANVIAGVWALVARRVPRLRTRSLWWFTVFAELSIFVQVVTGVVLVSAGGLRVEQFHMFYGFVSLITVAILYSYRSHLRGRIHLLYGFGGLFLAGLAIRAMLVASR
ncbi:MAG: hypothetical protein KatS3mg008_0730 [Acidimicrobiales bacterium]|nr:MAG: hypothetical protein KatS3mg008_0730 [Acidimicrobiales bacterium]